VAGAGRRGVRRCEPAWGDSAPENGCGENEFLVRRWLRSANSRAAPNYGRLFTDDYVGHVPGRAPLTLAKLMRSERAVTAAFTQIRHDVQDLVSARDKVVVRLLTSAVYSEALPGMGVAGGRFRMTSIVIYRLRAGRIAESWGEFDVSAALGLMRREGPVRP